MFNVEILVKGCVIIISGREIDPITGIPYYKTIYDYYSPAEIMFKSKTSGETYSTSAHEGQYKISVPAGEYTAYAKPINNDFVNPEPEDVVIKQNKYIDCPEPNAMFGFIEFINLPIIFSSDNGFEEGKISLETIEEDYPEIYNWLEDEYELNGEIKIVGATLVFEGDYEKYRFKVADLVIDGIELVLLAKAVIVAFPAAVTVGGYLTLVGKEFVGAIPTEIIETVGKEIASGGWPDPSDVSTPDPERNVYELFVTVLNSEIIETHLFYLDKHARWQHRYVQTHLYQLSDSNVVLQGKVVDDENNALNKVKLVATDVYGTVLAGAETNPSGDYKLTFPLRAGVYEDEFLFGIVPVTQQHVKLILSKEG
ncbi:carboxypeptidase regulatory-like domain-containing protein, partial [bacterium]|nr:carboxypeptidase regulatory-like domain-containing protein [bacterium]